MIETPNSPARGRQRCAHETSLSQAKPYNPAEKAEALLSAHERIHRELDELMHLASRDTPLQCGRYGPLLEPGSELRKGFTLGIQLAAERLSELVAEKGGTIRQERHEFPAHKQPCARRG